MAQTEHTVDSIIQKLEEKAKGRHMSIWIPSLKKQVKFKRLTLGQQKALIKSSIQENMLKLDFSGNIYTIIKSNILDKKVKVDELNIIDKICIGVAYRAKDINNEYGFYTEKGFFEVDLNEQDSSKAESLIKQMCEKLLVNQIIEDFKIEKEK